uniref:Secreted protein n=1 Tax=Kalanchoe fedtschenkoi TaxID=63787 RepID=A0A7N0T735_KALFE
MKGSSSCSLVASVFAASTAALASSSSTHGDASFTPCCCEGSHLTSSRGSAKSAETNSAAAKDKFAPRFDGLRFIETLVTAHR